jgi:hypothetical protein
VCIYNVHSLDIQLVTMALIISPKVRTKLANKKPPVTKEEIEQCFVNRTGKYLLDIREEHAENP